MSEIHTLEDVARHNAKVAGWRSVAPAKAVTARKEYVPMKTRKRGMNRLELAYAGLLSDSEEFDEIEWWAFEPMKLRLAEGTYFTPDFGVIRDGKLEFHECKGFMREAARVRLNVAADKFPFIKFYLVRKAKSGFTVNRVGSVPRGTGEGE